MEIVLVGECENPHEMKVMKKEDFLELFGADYDLSRYDFEKFNYTICEKCRRLFTYKNEVN